MSRQNDSAIGAVVFDLDGLMFNTEDVFELAGQRLLGARGKQLTPELRKMTMGRRAEESLAIMAESLQLPDSVDELLVESERILYELLSEHLAPMPGLFELLDAIERAGLPKAVATSSPRSYLVRVLGQFRLEERFHITLTAEDVQQGKPHPEIYLTAAERLGVAPSQMLVLEDSETGTRAAAAAGAHIVSIPHRHSRMQDFSVATFVASSLADAYILHLIDSATR